MRKPVAAGKFYPADSPSLLEMIKACFASDLGPGKETIKEKLAGAVVPHAGYPYSGAIAAHVYSRLTVKSAVILGTNHSGLGTGFDSSNEPWLTPLGEMHIDTKLRDKIAEHCDLRVEESAHELEHSIEVQLPFLQYKGVEKIVPISVAQLSPTSLRELGDALERAKPPLILASSDFSHYITQKMAEKIDLAAIEFILKDNPEGFSDYVDRNHASICGSAPITALLYAMAGKKGKLLKYCTSGEMTGDRDHVVGYGAIGFK